MTKKEKNKDNQNSFFQNLPKHFSVLLLKGISLLPFSALYGLSDFIFFLNKYFIRYRFDVVTENLKAAFPDKSMDEITQIRERFYHHFFDVSLEAVKQYGMNKEQMEDRMSFSGVEQMEQKTGERGGAIFLAYHFNNWEWTVYLQDKMKPPLLIVFNPPRYNKPMENFLVQSRGKWGGISVRTGLAGLTALRYQQKNKPAVLALAADQTALASASYWTTFMNREAAFFSGPVRLAKKTNHPIYFLHIDKLARGKYKANYTLLVDEPAKVSDADILRAYVDKMEEHIKEKPEFYLWSHRRWKHTRPEKTPLI